MAVADRQNGTVVDVSFGASGIADTSAPTVAEVAALTSIECGIVDGPDVPRSGSQIDLSALCDEVDRQKAGNISEGPITATLYREFDGTDAYWALFDDATSGAQHLVICRAGFTSGTPTATDVVDVFTVEVMSRSEQAPTRADAQRFNVELAVIESQRDVAIVA